MRDREDDGIRRLQRVELGQRDTIFMPGVGSVRQRIMDLHREAERLELANDVDDTGIARVRHVFLEGQAEDGHNPALTLAPQQPANAFARDCADPCRH